MKKPKTRKANDDYHSSFLWENAGLVGFLIAAAYAGLKYLDDVKHMHYVWH